MTDPDDDAPRRTRRPRGTRRPGLAVDRAPEGTDFASADRDAEEGWPYPDTDGRDADPSDGDRRRNGRPLR